MGYPLTNKTVLSGERSQTQKCNLNGCFRLDFGLWTSFFYWQIIFDWTRWVIRGKRNFSPYIPSVDKTFLGGRRYWNGSPMGYVLRSLISLPVKKANGPRKENKAFDMWFDKDQSDREEIRVFLNCWKHILASPAAKFIFGRQSKLDCFQNSKLARLPK